MTGSIEAIVFPKQYPMLQSQFVEDAILVIKGRLRLRERLGSKGTEEVPLELSVSVSDVQPFARRAPIVEPVGWHLTVGRREQIDALARLVDESPGTVPLVLHIGPDSARTPRGIAPNAYVREALERIFGAANVRESPP